MKLIGTGRAARSGEAAGGLGFGDRGAHDRDVGIGKWLHPGLAGERGLDERGEFGGLALLAVGFVWLGIAFFAGLGLVTLDWIVIPLWVSVYAAVFMGYLLATAPGRSIASIWRACCESNHLRPRLAVVIRAAPPKTH